MTDREQRFFRVVQCVQLGAAAWEVWRVVGGFYKYKWLAGAWGERVADYHAEIRVFELEVDRLSMVQWSSTFRYYEDAVSDFYWNGFRALQKRFPLPT